MHLTGNKRKKPISNKVGFTAPDSLWLQTNALSATLTFMQTGAHPDDETSPALAYLAREVGARVVYCCAVRGEGGQNSIGSEKETALGVLRTREMEQAASNIPMALYWLNTELEGAIRDFGFSKSKTDTLKHWGEERLLESLVRSIRTIKPNVICPTFLDVEGQHGHHRAVTEATIKAYTLAAEKTAYPEHLTQGLDIWQANQLLLPAWGGGGTCYDDQIPPPSMDFTLPTDSILRKWKMSCFQLGEESRQFHQTQQMGLELDASIGEKARFHIVSNCFEANKNNCLGGGVPLSLHAWAERYHEQPCGKAIARLAQQCEQIRSNYPDQQQMICNVITALEIVEDLVPTDPYLKEQLLIKKTQLISLLANLADLTSRVEMTTDLMCCEQLVPFTYSVLNNGVHAVKNLTLRLFQQSGELIYENEIGSVVRDETLTHLSQFTAPKRMFFPYQQRFIDACDYGSLYGEISFLILGVEVTQKIAMPATIVRPKVSLLSVEPNRYLNLKKRLDFDISLQLNCLDSRIHSLDVSPTLPIGWKSEPSKMTLDVKESTNQDIQFKIITPVGTEPGRYEITVEAKNNTECWRSSFQTIQYPHIQETGFSVPTRVVVEAVDCELPSSKIGCFLGTTDNYLRQLSSLGFEIEPIDNLKMDTLNRFDVLLIGSCAFASISRYPALKSWVENGGRLITLYHRPDDNWQPPAKLTIGSPSMRWRVTQADSPVIVLQPDSEIMLEPNLLTDSTWQHWRKERGLYFIKEWGSVYKPLLRIFDEDGTEFDGILLYGCIEKGQHIHCSLSVGHQLENTVSGAASFVANLLNKKEM
ncbi:PIG-L family deacetylase [Vibrio sp. VB16]|uniref:PIG-L family deacetylase n=1 Tax=Vibrio sp. VB16 TaxID=2785746 RepID=UPI00189D2B20|nr:PIG-L family deacetylase [Vibrio sp. VB16]UGA56163.1 PIG-L family deacetylase [Vibrio sp. VB16]